MTPPGEVRIEWSDEARADVRRIGRTAAMHIFDGVLRCAGSGGGDVVPLHGDMAGYFRLRVGDYRVLFALEQGTMRIFRVHHRREAYR